MAKRDIPAEDLARAEQLLNDGESLRSASRATNISTDTLKRRFPGSGHASSKPTGSSSGEHEGARRRRDPRPKPRAGSRPRAVKSGPSDEQLEKMLRKVAIAPSIPMKMWVHCDYCTMHFVTQGPEVARQLVELSADYPELREMLEALWSSWEKYMWAGVLAGWLGIPLMHHLAPAGVYGALAPLAGMPPRTPAAAPTHAHAPASNGAAPPPEPEPATASDDLLAGTPLAGLDTDEILAMADQFGLEVPPEILAALGKLPDTDADTAPPTEPTEPESDEPATAAAEAAAAASDQDADEH